MLPPPGDLRDLLLQADQPDGDVGGALIDSGFVTRDELRATLESAVVDALIVLTVPLADEAFVSDIRLKSPRPHWAGSLCRVGVAAARTEAEAVAERMTRYEVPHTAHLELRDLDRPSAVLTPEQWAVAGKINGALTTWDLAWQCGLALRDTFEAVGELALAGMCAPAPAAEAELPPGSPPAMPRRGQVTAVRRTAADTVPDVPVQAGEPADEARVAPMPLDSLRRVLDGLRRLG
jgi:hypothetical protein